MTIERIRVGTGSGFSDDRIDPAADLAERGNLDYLVFECLAERTIARETLARLKDPERGYTPHLAERFQAVLPACRRNGVRIVSNMGAANPAAAARAVRREAKALVRIVVDHEIHNGIAEVADAVEEDQELGFVAHSRRLGPATRDLKGPPCSL